MRFTIGLALVAALGAAACKKKTADMSATGSGSSSGTSTSSATGSGSAAQPAPLPVPVDAVAAGPWKVPASATAGHGDVDATALGPAVVAHLVERIWKPAPNDDYRSVKLLLVLEGSGKSIVADETDTYAQDGSPAAMAIKTESDIVLSPLEPARSFQGSDADTPLDFKGPLVFLVHLTAKAENRVIAVGKDKDSLVVWQLVIPSDAVDVAPEWDATGTIKLAPGAAVTGAGSGS